ncbi:DUF4347 domain-containing protein [Phenylobacterium sp.]|uniref:DUF4347 domain-containing protein n=1 Tax=Phenylobacterium sp. TaxID=1871053 RepID=UPI00263A12DF|nr:DUF4347 domain-containing protein [Phenylobacterium sp.]
MTSPIATGANGPSAEIVFVDARTPDVDAVIAGFQGAEVVWIESDRDGVEQIRDALAGRTDVSAVHLVGHGDEGLLLMGSGSLHSGNLADYGQALAEIGQALSEDGDIHLWGCDVGAGEAGAAFIQGLAEATGADIAASTDATGGAHLGGDWTLEITTGTVAASNAVDAEALADADIHLATFSVASLAELKTALSTAASNGVADIITFTANITAAGQGDFTSGYLAAVNLAESHALTIVGGGFSLDANYYGGALSVSSGDNVEIQNLTIRGGLLAGPGGDAPAAGGSGLGAGIANQGALTLRDVTVTQNVASGGGGGGGTTGGSYTGGGGGGGGFSGRGGAAGGDVATGGSAPTGNPSGATGGAGGGSYSIGGGGGSAVGGSGGQYGPSNGGSGGSASNGSIAIGGGGGGGGYSGVGGAGGSAAGGVFNASGATLTVVGTSVISNNLGAGGGGGGGGSGTYGSNQDGGAGGRGVGAIWNEGVVKITAANFSAMTGNAGASGAGGLEGGTGSSGVTPTAQNNIYNAGTLDAAFVENTAPAIAGTAATPAINDTATTTPFAPLSFTDAEGAGGTIAITYTAANGALSGEGLTGTAGSYTLTGASPAELSARLQALVFTPTGNQTAVGGTVQTTFTLTPNDGTASGAAHTTTQVTTTSVNDAPTATNLTQTVTYTEDPGGAVALGDIVVSDVDAGETITATLTLSTPAAGVLSTGTFGAATSTYNPGTGVWTVTGSTADVNAALAQTAFTPAGDRDQDATITTRVRDASDAGPADGTITLDVTPVNDAPILTTSGGSLAYAENATATVIDGALTLSDIDSATLPGATVQITGHFAAGQDVLAFTNSGGMGNVSASFNAATGTLTLMSPGATASVAQWQAALRSVTYVNTSDTPDASARTVTFMVDDGFANSGAATRTIAVTSVNDAPTTDAGKGYLNTGAATETGGLVTIANTMLREGDLDDSGTGITYTVTTAPTEGALFIDANGNSTADGGEALTAAATFTQDDIDQGRVKYMHGGGGGVGDSFGFSVADGGEDGAAALTGQTFGLSITARPVIAVGAGSPAHVEDGAATVLAPALTVTDADSANLTGATIRVTDFVSGDGLGFVDQNGISGSYNGATGVLTLSGGATVANYESALRSITYSTTSANPSTGAGNGNRVIEFSVSDGGLNSVGQTLTLAVSNANDAPVLDATNSPSLTGLVEDAPAPTNGSAAGSTLVSSLLGGASDVDSGALQGMALVGSSAQGTLWYSIDSGVTWTQAPALSATSALLLASNARVYFQPGADVAGTLTDAITFRAWDRTSGANGGTADVSTNGAGTAFSSSTDVVSLAISNVNDLPTGAVAVSGAPLVGSTLGIDQTLADADGFDPANFAYQWMADGVDIGGATASTLTVTQGLFGHVITVKISYTDDRGAAESVTSAGTAAVTNPPPPPPSPSPTVPTSGDDQLVLPNEGGSVSAGDGDDKVTGALGDDVMHGNAGVDSLSAGAGSDIARGGQQNDFVQGNSGNDLVFGDRGDDIVHGGKGADLVQGNTGNDVVLGDDGDDIIRGGQGDDQVFGGQGADLLFGDLGNDSLTGGSGADAFHFPAGSQGRDLITDFARAEGDRIVIDSPLAANFGDLASRVSQAADGSAIIDLGDLVITLQGVAPGALEAGDFLFG